ncbi:MAG: alanine--tRNA ligase [Candidatus Omnitrophica bacterium]|nr:alanine--tRNA ligase [Candidatus Omnitrophota bacterium]
MTASELRKRFLEYFKGKGHTVVSSDSLVPMKDPTLLFTSAGMTQFKDYFLGLKSDMKRAASCQKCFRTGDVERVGTTPSHLTFFEMLGNFSFGDYFKKEAILWSWEFFTRELGIPKEKLRPSVYEKDDEAFDIWKNVIGIPVSKISRFGAKDNFWPSNAPTDGPNGPCGPCSEIYYDYQRCTIGKKCPDPDHCSPSCSCGRFVEVWNLVFTQFDRQSDGSLLPLPAKNIDTGMGLERLAAVMQGKQTVFETDLFAPIVEEIRRLVNRQALEETGKNQQALLYAIADHARALTFLVADGIVPSNEGRGYVMRMLLRKAQRAGMGLGLEGSFLCRLVPVVTRIMEQAYPELTHRRESIAKVILAEEEKFQQTLKEKIPLLREAIARSKHDAPFDARAAAQFYDTHGLSYDEIVQECSRARVEAPKKADFEKALAQLQAKSKTASTFAGDIFAKDKMLELLAGRKPTDFLRDAGLKAHARVVALVRDGRLVEEVRSPGPVDVVLDQTPFYGEAGGQVGDAGTIEAVEGKLAVSDTQWVGNLLLHRAQLQDGRVRVNDPVTASVDPERRKRVSQNHTATHLLHAALRRVLGEHVVQAGSLVAPDHLRFDFSHDRGLSHDQRESVESLVNEWVWSHLPVSTVEMPIDEAKRSGAMSLFGEKYGERVRVVTIGDISKELCGGTHLKTSLEIGVIAITGEGSVAAGVRRLEALTGNAVLDSMREEFGRLERNHERLLKRNKQLEEEKAFLSGRVKS